MAAKYEIEKFNESNFTLWKMKMKGILRKNKCLEAIGKRPKEITDEKKWEELNDNVVANLHLAISNGILLSMNEKMTSTKIWERLTKLYEVKSQHTKIFLKRRLYTLRMVESTTVTKHLKTLNILFPQLTAMEHNINKIDRAEILLQSLSDSYDQIIINLINSIAVMTFDDVPVAVLEEENWH